MFKIGNLEIENNVCLAPMAGVCNSAFRRIVKEYGAGLLFAEMVSDKALMYDSEKTKKMLYMTEEERPIAQQIFGSDKESFVIAAKKVYELMHPDIIDINMGCPVPKVAIKNQAGSALLKNPEKIKEIVSRVVAAVDIPVTVKIRSGWDEEHINAVEVAKACESAGASAIAVHARTRSQGYSGHADWNIIKQVKESVSIPVIGNGDVTSCFLAKKMLDETGCDAVMIGRGLLGNPWLVRECVDYLRDGTLPKEVSYKEKIAMMRRHYKLLCEDTNEVSASLEIRSHVLYYLKGMPKSKEMKNKICQCKNAQEIFSILDEYEHYLESLIV